MNLQDQICLALEKADGSNKFVEDSWQRPEGGGGRLHPQRSTLVALHEPSGQGSREAEVRRLRRSARGLRHGPEARSREPRGLRQPHGCPRGV